jgi:hypothetical protein
LIVVKMFFVQDSLCSVPPTATLNCASKNSNAFHPYLTRL